MKRKLECSRVAFRLLSLLTALTLSGCNPPAVRQAASAGGGQQATTSGEAPAAQPRLVSLAPSDTEILLEMQGQNTICGVCSNCPKVLSDNKWVKEKPIVGSFVSVNFERLAKLKPDAVLLVSGQEPIAAQLKKKSYRVLILPNRKLSDIATNIQEIGKVANQSKLASALHTHFIKRISQFKTIMKVAAPVKVFYCIWPQPLITIGNTSFLNDVITACGGTNIAASLSQPYPQFTAEKLLISDPDVVILPYEMKGSAAVKKFPWTSLRAVKRGRIHFLPAPEDDLLARPTTRLVRGLPWLARILHPEKAQEIKRWEDENPPEPPKLEAPVVKGERAR